MTMAISPKDCTAVYPSTNPLEDLASVRQRLQEKFSNAKQMIEGTQVRTTVLSHEIICGIGTGYGGSYTGYDDVLKISENELSTQDCSTENRALSRVFEAKEVEKTYRAIDESLLSGRHVYVCCSEDFDFSVAVIAGYLIDRFELTAETVGQFFNSFRINNLADSASRRLRGSDPKLLAI